MNLEPRFSVANNKTENSKSVTRTTGEFDTTLYVGGDNYTTDPETKDDNENRAYVTITKILPNAYPDFLGIAVRVCEYPDGPAMTAIRKEQLYLIELLNLRLMENIIYKLPI